MSESVVYVVRVWRDGKSFRATARAVEHEDTRVFSEPLGLLRFLQGESGAKPVATERASPSTKLHRSARQNRP